MLREMIDAIARTDRFIMPVHIRFLKHLIKVADALEDIVDVYDRRKDWGEELKAVKRVLNDKSK